MREGTYRHFKAGGLAMPQDQNGTSNRLTNGSVHEGGPEVGWCVGDVAAELVGVIVTRACTSK